MSTPCVEKSHIRFLLNDVSVAHQLPPSPQPLPAGETQRLLPPFPTLLSSCASKEGLRVLEPPPSRILLRQRLLQQVASLSAAAQAEAAKATSVNNEIPQVPPKRRLEEADASAHPKQRRGRGGVMI